MSKMLLIRFPGLGYHVNKPLLKLTYEKALEYGFETSIDIAYKRKDSAISKDKNTIKNEFEYLYEQVTEQLKDINFSEYEMILVISKSIGTALAARYIKEHSINAFNIYLTPLDITFNYEPKNAIFFTGDKDPWVTLDEVKMGCNNANLPLFIIKDGNHSLTLNSPEEEGYTEHCDAMLKLVINETENFLEKVMINYKNK